MTYVKGALAMRFDKVVYYGEDFCFHTGTVVVENGKIIGIQETYSKQTEEEYYLLPGLIDLHLHGCGGMDFSDGTAAAIETMARYQIAHGITTFCPAAMAEPENQMEKICGSAVSYQRRQQKDGAAFAGFMLEGPFLSPDKKGAQKEDFLRTPEIVFFNRLCKLSEDQIKIVCVAPELPGAAEFIAAAAEKAVVALAHTEADYETAFHALHSGATHVTHLFNAMPPLHHRRPGVIGAAADSENVMVELISDCVHVHESVVRLAFRVFSSSRIVFISDSTRACGMPNGTYTLGGQKIQVSGGKAVLKDGTLAGSVVNLFDCMKKSVEIGIPLEDAVRCCTYNPASVLGLLGTKGSISVGKDADLLLCRKDLRLMQAYRGGRLLFNGD